MTYQNIRYRHGLLAILAGMLLLPLAAGAAQTIEGKINGLRCATQGIVCPIDKLDPMIAAEQDFVVQLPDGSFYYIHNLDRAVKARYVLEDVKITGEVSDKYRSIDASKLEVKRDGEYKTVWSPELQATIWQELVQPGATRR